METTAKKFSVKTVALIGMFIALSFVVTFLSKLIPINIAGFLTFDLKDVIVAICGFIMGPLPAVITAVISSLIEMLTISSTGPIGFVMNILSTCAFVVPAAILYNRKKKFTDALIGIIIGIICMAAIMILWNWLITPLYMGVPRDVVVATLRIIRSVKGERQQIFTVAHRHMLSEIWYYMATLNGHMFA